MFDEILEDKSVNLSHLQSLANLQYLDFGHYHFNIWIQFVQTLGTSCIYKTYLDNCIAPACFSPLITTLILVSCTLFQSLLVVQQCFLQQSYSFSLCLHWLFALMVYTHLQFMLVNIFQILFCFIYQDQFVNKYV